MGNTHNIHCFAIHFTHVVMYLAKVDDTFLGHEIFYNRHDDEDLIDDVPVRQKERWAS